MNRFDKMEQKWNGNIRVHLQRWSWIFRGWGRGPEYSGVGGAVPNIPGVGAILKTFGRYRKGHLQDLRHLRYFDFHAMSNSKHSTLDMLFSQIAVSYLEPSQPRTISGTALKCIGNAHRDMKYMCDCPPLYYSARFGFTDQRLILLLLVFSGEPDGSFP